MGIRSSTLDAKVLRVFSRAAQFAAWERWDGSDRPSGEGEQSRSRACRCLWRGGGRRFGSRLMNRGGSAARPARPEGGAARRRLPLSIRSPLPVAAIGLSGASLGEGWKLKPSKRTLTLAWQTTNFFLPGLRHPCSGLHRPQGMSKSRETIGKIEPPEHGAACVLHVVDAELEVDFAPGHGAIDTLRAREDGSGAGP